MAKKKKETGADLSSTKHLRRCLQGCGRFVSRTRNFCSDHCRHRYDPETWGEGRGRTTLTPILKESLRLAKKEYRRTL